jgi:hypothetical protein
MLGGLTLLVLHARGACMLWGCMTLLVLHVGGGGMTLFVLHVVGGHGTACAMKKVYLWHCLCVAGGLPNKLLVE